VDLFRIQCYMRSLILALLVVVALAEEVSEDRPRSVDRLWQDRRMQRHDKTPLCLLTQKLEFQSTHSRHCPHGMKCCAFDGVGWNDEIGICVHTHSHHANCGGCSESPYDYDHICPSKHCHDSKCTCEKHTEEHDCPSPSDKNFNVKCDTRTHPHRCVPDLGSLIEEASTVEVNTEKAGKSEHVSRHMNTIQQAIEKAHEKHLERFEKKTEKLAESLAEAQHEAEERLQANREAREARHKHDTDNQHVALKHGQRVPQQ